MKTFKKLISVILCVLTVFSFTSLLAFAESENLNYLVLGDSIAKGFGVKNSREASYGRIVANTNGYNYINRGFAGCTSEDLLENVKENEYSYIERELREVFDSKVKISKNKIEIGFVNDNDLNRILEIMNIKIN